MNRLEGQLSWFSTQLGIFSGKCHPVVFTNTILLDTHYYLDNTVYDETFEEENFRTQEWKIVIHAKTFTVARLLIYIADRQGTSVCVCVLTVSVFVSVSHISTQQHG